MATEYLEAAIDPPPELADAGCAVCGAAIDALDTFCSAECAQALEAELEQWDREQAEEEVAHG